MGRKTVRVDPKKGIGGCRSTAESPGGVAQLLYKGTGPDQDRHWGLAGAEGGFNTQVPRAFVELQFADLNLVRALRQFPRSLRLPGEAQKIVP